MKVCEPSVTRCTDKNDPNVGSIGFTYNKKLTGLRGERSIIMTDSERYQQQMSLGWKVHHELVQNETTGERVLRVSLENLCDRHLFTLKQHHTGLNESRVTMGNSVEAMAQIAGDPDELLVKNSDIINDRDVITTIDGEYVTPKGYIATGELHVNPHSATHPDPDARGAIYSAYLAIRLRADNSLGELVIADLANPNEEDLFGLGAGDRAVPFGLLQADAEGKIDYGTFTQCAHGGGVDFGDGDDIGSAILQALRAKLGGKGDVSIHRLEM
jgi:hypothetical protein